MRLLRGRGTTILALAVAVGSIVAPLSMPVAAQPSQGKVLKAIRDASELAETMPDAFGGLWLDGRDVTFAFTHRATDEQVEEVLALIEPWVPLTIVRVDWSEAELSATLDALGEAFDQRPAFLSGAGVDIRNNAVEVAIRPRYFEVCQAGLRARYGPVRLLFVTSDPDRGVPEPTPTPDVTPSPTSSPDGSLPPACRPPASPGPVPSQRVLATPTPTPSPRPSPGNEASSAGLGWVPVSLELPDDHYLTDLTAWAGGFATLETHHDSSDVFALWSSPDGTTWDRSSLPKGVDNGRMVALGDHLYLLESRGRGDPQELRIRTWRTSDGRDWQRQGLFEWHLPRWVGDDWMMVVPHVVAAPDRLVMFGEVWPCCGNGGSTPATTRYASLVAAEVPERVPLRGLVIWTSPDGARWTRQSNADLREPVSGNAWVTDATGIPQGVLVTRESTDAGLFASPDGSRWESMGPLPPGYSSLDSLGLVMTDDRVIVSFRVRDASGDKSLEIWLRPGSGTWRRSLQEFHMVLNDLVATGPVVVASAQSIDTGTESLPIALVSSDGGLTWAPDTSLTGQPGWCARDLATDGTRLVMLGCEEGSPTLWSADMPAPVDGAT